MKSWVEMYLHCSSGLIEMSVLDNTTKFKAVFSVVNPSLMQ